MDNNDVFFWQMVVGSFSAAYITPVVTELLKRWPLGERFSASVAVFFNIGMYLIGWLVFSHNPDSLKYWILCGMGMGGASNAYRQASKTTPLPDFSGKFQLPNDLKK